MADYSIHAAMSGTELARVRPAGGTWRATRAGNGGGTFTYNLDDGDESLTRDDVWQMLEPNDRLVAVNDGDHVAYLGVIGDWEYDRESRSITIAHTEYRTAIFPQRMTFGVNQYQNGDLLISNRSRNGAARAVLSRAQQWSPEWATLVDVDALPDGAGTFSLDVRRWQTFKIEDLLALIEKDGCEIYLRPYRTATGVRLQPVVSVRYTNGTIDLDATVDESPVIGLTYRRDGNQQVTGVLGVGNGTGSKMVTEWAGSVTGQTIPIRDVKREFKDIKDPAQLKRAAQAVYDELRNPIEQLSFGVNLDDGLSLADVQIGRVIRLETNGDAVIPDGVRDLRVISLAGTVENESEVTPEVQPV